jgi:hypothetical protein
MNLNNQERAEVILLIDAYINGEVPDLIKDIESEDSNPVLNNYMKQKLLSIKDKISIPIN